MRHMNSEVVVRKGGFFTALAHGFFGLLITVVVCAASLAAYAVHVADGKAGMVLGLGRGLVELLPELQEALPPVLADALDDRRDPGYRSEVELDVRLTERDGDRHDGLVIDVKNTGDKTITLMAIRVVMLDEEGVPVRAVNTYAATPLTIEHDWRGPILPGSTRHCALSLYRCPANLTPEVEVTDLRVWNEVPQVAMVLDAG